MKTPHAFILQFLSVKCWNSGRPVKVSHRRWECFGITKRDLLYEKDSQYVAYCATTEEEK